MGVRVRRFDDRVVLLWAVLLPVVALGPALLPGYVLIRDMVWVPDLAVRPDVLGLGSGLPRAVPSDAVVAVLDDVIPGMILQKLVLLGSLVAAGVGAARLVPGERLVVRLVAAGAMEWNPFVAERLAMGHWPVLMALGVLPWLLVAAREWRTSGRLPARLGWLLPLGALSASAGIATAIALIAAGWSRARRPRFLLLTAAFAANAPWVVTGLLHSATATSDPAAARIFALHGEGSIPAPVSALSLGGIWNSDVVPGSRTGALGWAVTVAVVAVALLGCPRWWRHTPSRDRTSLLCCWAIGYATAVLTWLLPAGSAWLAQHVPGGGLLRDGSRMLLLCIPLVSVLVGQGAGRLLELIGAAGGLAPSVLGPVLVVLPIALLPGLALGDSGQLRAVSYPSDYARLAAVVNRSIPRGVDVLVLPLSSYRAMSWNHGLPVLDPVPRLLPRTTVSSDQLVVDGVTLGGEDPRVGAVASALGLDTPESRSRALVRDGVGGVVIERDTGQPLPAVAGRVVWADSRLEVVALDGTVPHHPPGWQWLVAALAWLAFLGLPIAGVISGVVIPLRRGGR